MSAHILGADDSINQVIGANCSIFLSEVQEARERGRGEIEALIDAKLAKLKKDITDLGVRQGFWALAENTTPVK